MFSLKSIENDDYSFSWERALSIAILNEITRYGSQKSIIRQIDMWGFEGYKFVDIGFMTAAIFWSSDAVVLCYPGVDWIDEFIEDPVKIWVRRRYGLVGINSRRKFLIDIDYIFSYIRSVCGKYKKFFVSGHNVGGSVALLALAGSDFTDMNLRGIYTYGQPKFIDINKNNLSSTGDEILKQFNPLIHRVISDSDIVTSFPRDFIHVGIPHMLGEQGTVYKEGYDAPFLGADESCDIFDPNDNSIGRYVRLLSYVVRSQDVENKFSMDRNIINFLRDGFISDGGRNARSLDNINFDSMKDFRYRRSERHEVRFPVPDPGLYNEQSGFYVPSRPIKNKIPVLISLKDHLYELPDYIDVQSRLGNIASAFVGVDDILLLYSNKNIMSIELSRERGGLEIEKSKDFVRYPSYSVGVLSEKGDKSIIAIIDTGVDVCHKAFQHNDETRIIYLWDQTCSDCNESPKTKMPGICSQSYGKLYTSKDINAQIKSGEVENILRDHDGHGTHVASIAAGSCFNDFSGGISPASKLIVVIPRLTTKQGDPQSVGYSNGHFDALSFIDAIAKYEGLPVVVNVSMGMNAGAHDGTSPLEVGFDNFTGLGQATGRVIVKSAGNERGLGSHGNATVAENSISIIKWESDKSKRAIDYIELWFKRYTEISFRLINPKGSSTSTISLANPEVSEKLDGNICRVELVNNYQYNGDNLLSISIESNPEGEISSGVWALEMCGESIAASDDAGCVHAWVERSPQGNYPVRFITGDTDGYTISIPGTAKHVITVAACKLRMPAQLTETSSFGPTRTRDQKPDITAPGDGIQAALSGTSNSAAQTIRYGTSMAAPHVAGAIALALSMSCKKGKMYTAIQIKNILLASTQKFTAKHDNGFGYGLLDIKGFLSKF